MPLWVLSSGSAAEMKGEAFPEGAAGRGRGLAASFPPLCQGNQPCRGGTVGATNDAGCAKQPLQNSSVCAAARWFRLCSRAEASLEAASPVGSP